MGQRHLLGWGGGWCSNAVASDDAVGLFKWLLSVNQSGDGTIRTSFLEEDAVGGNTGFLGTGAGGDSFNADIKLGQIPWESNGVEGELVAIGSVAHSEGANGSWGIKAGSEGSLGLEVTFSNAPDLMTWVFKFVATPGDDGCPNIEVFGHNATKSDNDFYWGDSLNRDVVPEQRLPPQVCISPNCLGHLGGLFVGEKLPLETENDVTGGIFHTAIES